MAKSKTTAAKPRRLGRGLSSLIGEPVRVDAVVHAPQTVLSEDEVNGGRDPGIPTTADLPQTSSQALVTGDRQLQIINVDDIQANPNQPRRSMDDGALAALAKSIGDTGMMQPIVVRRVERDGVGAWEIVAGERGSAVLDEEGRVALYDETGKRRSTVEKATAIAWDGEDPIVSTEQGVIVLASTGARSPIAAPPATALARLGDVCPGEGLTGNKRKTHHLFRARGQCKIRTAGTVVLEGPVALGQ